MLSAAKPFPIFVLLLFGAADLSKENESGTKFKESVQALDYEQALVKFSSQSHTVPNERLGIASQLQTSKQDKQEMERKDQPENNEKENRKIHLKNIELSKQPTEMQETKGVELKNQPATYLDEVFPPIQKELDNQLLNNTDDNRSLELSELQSVIAQDDKLQHQLPNKVQTNKKRKLWDVIRIKVTESHNAELERYKPLSWTKMQTRQTKSDSGPTIKSKKKSFRVPSMSSCVTRTKSYINKRFGRQGSLGKTKDTSAPEKQPPLSDEVGFARPKPIPRPPSLRPESPQQVESAPTPQPRKKQGFYLIDHINNIVMIPGSGEFVYDTKIQKRKAVKRIYVDQTVIREGTEQSINGNNIDDISDAMLSLKQLKEDLPNVQWISVVVNWFADSLNIGECEIYPAVEFNDGFIWTPDDWQVGNLKRNEARRISRDGNGKLRHGGTVSDGALIRYINELHHRGYKVMLYPKLLLDTPAEDWRGRMTGFSHQVDSFFEDKYNPFINHYSHIAKETKVEAFIIGSEFVGLTRMRDVFGNYPAISELVNLAEEVKLNLGKEVIVTYAADWAEYGISYGGWYPMDELWSSEYIDVVGINAYFPLTDRYEPPSGFSVEDIIRGWTTGEGYDYLLDYSTGDPELIPYIDKKWAGKNIENWWGNPHFNPDFSFTKWRPGTKKIWFTEFGYPSVDACTNDPYVFVESISKYSLYPRFSTKKVSFNSQRIAIEGTIRKWLGSEMVEKMFLYAWDARPFPYFPVKREVWKDGANWATGPWIQGKIGRPLGDKRESVVASRRSLSLPTNKRSPTGSTFIRRGSDDQKT